MTQTTLNRRKLVADLLADRTNLIVTTGLGSSTYDVMAEEVRVLPSRDSVYIKNWIRAALALQPG